MTRIVCIADQHFQSNHPRNAQRIASMEQAVTEGLALSNLGAWVLVGDLFHTRSNAADRNLAADFLTRMGNAAPVLVLGGNHEAPGDLDIFEKLRTGWPITVATRPWTYRIRLASGGDFGIFCLPYPHKAGLVAAGTPAAEIPARASEALDAIFMGAVAELAPFPRAMMVGHGTIGGARSSVGQPMGLEHDIAVTPLHLDRLGNIPKIFGHIHLPQELYGAHYVGSIAANDWGERERKRFLVVEFDNSGGWHLVSHPLDTPQLYHVEGELTPERFSYKTSDGYYPGVGDVYEGPIPPEVTPDWTGTHVRVQYKFNQAEKAALREDVIREHFKGAARLDLDPVPVRTRAIRNPEVAAAQTVSAKVEAFVRSAGLNWTPSLETKLAALQGPDGAAFLSQVQRELQPREVAEVLS